MRTRTDNIWDPNYKISFNAVSVLQPDWSQVSDLLPMNSSKSLREIIRLDLIDGLNRDERISDESNVVSESHTLEIAAAHA